MDCRCPACRADLGKKKWSQAIVARMEMDCSHCGSRIRLNLHPAEIVIVLVNFGAVVVLAASAYWFQSQNLVLIALAAAMAGMLALPVLESTCLRTWPRYAATAPGPEP